MGEEKRLTTRKATESERGVSEGEKSSQGESPAHGCRRARVRRRVRPSSGVSPLCWLAFVVSPRARRSSTPLNRHATTSWRPSDAACHHQLASHTTLDRSYRRLCRVGELCVRRGNDTRLRVGREISRAADCGRPRHTQHQCRHQANRRRTGGTKKRKCNNQLELNDLW